MILEYSSMRKGSASKAGYAFPGPRQREDAGVARNRLVDIAGAQSGEESSRQRDGGDLQEPPLRPSMIG